MRVLVSGSSGLIGSGIIAELTSRGHVPLRLVRSAPKDTGDVRWHPENGIFDAAAAEGADAVVHLAGESIGSGRWTDEKKRRIRDSRVGGTRFLARAFADLDRPPRIFVCASAIGFYGDRGEAIVDEASPKGDGFLADVCHEWESAAESIRSSSIRLVHLRFGQVLSMRGGGLRQMLPVFRLGLGGRIGSGEQWMSWIGLSDTVRAVAFVLEREAIDGPVNLVSPEPVRNSDFTRTLGRVLNRPAILPVPAFLLRVALGEIADELLLASTRAVPGVLTREGFRFLHAPLEDALRAALA